MRAFWLRCLAVLIALAPAYGNAHAAMHPGGRHSEACAEEHGHGEGRPSRHHRQPVSDVRLLLRLSRLRQHCRAAATRCRTGRSLRRHPL